MAFVFCDSLADGRPKVKSLSLHRELSKLVTDHVLRHLEFDVVFAIMNRELEPNEAGENGGSTGLRLDRCRSFAWLFPRYSDTTWSIRSTSDEIFYSRRVIR
jgi:hypothetical protein